jgi:hypothetical protein
MGQCCAAGSDRRAAYLEDLQLEECQERLRGDRKLQLTKMETAATTAPMESLRITASSSVLPPVAGAAPSLEKAAATETIVYDMIGDDEHISCSAAISLDATSSSLSSLMASRNSRQSVLSQQPKHPYSFNHENSTSCSSKKRSGVWETNSSDHSPMTGVHFAAAGNTTNLDVIELTC